MLLAQPLLAAQDAASQPDAFIEKLIQDSQKHRRQRALTPEDSLFQAEIECAELAGDVSEYSHGLRLVMKGYAERGLWDEAEYLTTRMVGSGVPLGLAELALLSAQKHRPEQAMDLVAKTRIQLGLARARKKDIALRDCAIACLLAGKKDEAAALRAEMSSEEAWIVAAAFLDADAAGPLPEFDAAKELVLKAAIPAHAAAKYLLSAAGAQLRAGHREAGRAFIAEAMQMADHPKFHEAMERLLEAATLAQLHGLTEDRDRALKLFKDYAASLPAGADWKPAAHVHLAATLLSFGQRAEAEAELKLAEEAAPKVLVVTAAEGMIEIAQLWDKLGQPDKAADWLKKAAVVGMANTHQRARGAAGVRICLYFAAQKLPVPETIRQQLRQAKERS
ncbi:hypothetical protein BGE01nite_41420 [Brevifollis gellanilyticus]|uniref:Uncharacterized protein n=1 Tax=Brevifollis gellanilyticus TaxID=748831 RepID=A0A512MEN4_9BACT|nr:hypothetical protein BGE01nite_41420 [Brevifollis gellanilyticus]